MKTGNLRIGAKGERSPVKVPVSLAETVEDMQKLAHASLTVILRCFNRGFRIESQERSGAREAFRNGATQEVLAKTVVDYDPTVAAERGGPRAPKQVTLPKGKKSFTAEEIQALLSGAGIKATVSTAE